jgi:hypothetical protein
MREEERKRKVVERERQKNLKVRDSAESFSMVSLCRGCCGGLQIWQKTSLKNDPDSISRNIRLRQLLHGGEGQSSAKMDDTLAKHRASAAGMQADVGMGRGARAGQEKENMTEFIAKKREMFLVQMSLDTKREEIRKLEEKASMKVKHL